MHSDAAICPGTIGNSILPRFYLVKVNIFTSLSINKIIQFKEKRFSNGEKIKTG
jgi:hypothetical protein